MLQIRTLLRMAQPKNFMAIDNPEKLYTHVHHEDVASGCTQFRIYEGKEIELHFKNYCVFRTGNSRKWILVVSNKHLCTLMETTRPKHFLTQLAKHLNASYTQKSLLTSQAGLLQD